MVPMPLYEYRCEEGHTIEVVQRMSDDALEHCEVCGAATQRVMHAPAVHFKGKGFYNTDYGTKNRQREKEASEASSSAEKKSADGKSSDGKSSDSGGSSSDAKPDKKPDQKETAATSGS